MPIYIKVDGIRGTVTNHDHKERSGSANGGVWKTTNFLSSEAVSRIGGGPHIKVFSGTGGGNSLPSDAISVSRLSLAGGSSAVEGRDVTAKFKVEHLINMARNSGPNGKLFAATDAGVYQNSSRFDSQGRLVLGSDQGVWSSETNKFRGANNLKQISLAVQSSASVQIFVTDTQGFVVRSYRLPRVSVTGTGGTFTLTFDGQTTGGL